MNVFDYQAPLPELPGVEVLIDYGLLCKAFVLISDEATLASLAQSENTMHVYENMKYGLLSDWQELIGQNLAENWDYIGTGTTIAILDDGRGTLGGSSLPEDDWLIDLGLPEFGGCTDEGTPASCRVVKMVDLCPQDQSNSGHMTQVASYVARTAPGANLVLIDVGVAGEIDDSAVNLGLQWVLENQASYNVVAVNMSFGTAGWWFSTGDCPGWDDYTFELLHAAGVMPIAGSGNDGWEQNEYDGMSHPACSPWVVSAGASNGASSIESSTTRGPDLDVLAPAARTSYAAPQVSGAWAIFQAAVPEFALWDILELLKRTGYPIYDPESGYTFPLIQIDKALWDALGDPSEVAKLICGDNLSVLGKAIHLYVQDRNFPLEEWCDALITGGYVIPQTFICPSSPAQVGESSYALNENLLSATGPDVVMIFETTPGWNQVGGANLLSAESHAGEGCNICYADGHVEFVETEDIPALVWN